MAPAAANFETKGWHVSVEGLVQKPKTFDLDEILKLSPPEERIYRMRCVEAWSMVIPWVGFPLSKLLDAVQPLSSAKYVAFETLLDPKQMPGQKSDVLEWPYVEGLRMDEAMHPLAILASGIYGHVLPPQDGAPIRLVVPWKYGFKGIKSIVKIKLVANQPRTTWNVAASNEYGFYANVNPQVDHPRWSQATEQRIGESGRRPTLMFNGYAEQVGHLYAEHGLADEFLTGMKENDIQYAKLLVLVNGAVPLAILGWDAAHHQLGANPQNFAILTTGMMTLIFLILTMAVTPVRKVTGWNWLANLRRMLGLYAFFYGCAHFLLFFGLDRGRFQRAQHVDRNGQAQISDHRQHGAHCHDTAGSDLD